MSFNEWGDFFAGAFAPLAFLWLVIGYFQQGKELNQNTKVLQQQEIALKLQVKELKNSVEQQNKLAVTQVEQTEISSLIARLEAIKHIVSILEKKLKRVKVLDKVDEFIQVKPLEEKLANYERELDSIFNQIKNLK